MSRTGPPPIPAPVLRVEDVQTQRFVTRCVMAVPLTMAVHDACGDQQVKPRPLVVCAAADAMPRTGRAADGTPQGLDVAVIRQVASRLGREIELHWCAGTCAWERLADGRCDLVIGRAVGSTKSPKVTWSVPYSGGRHGLVVRRETRNIRALADLGGKRVGLLGGSAGPLPKDASVVRFKSRPAVIEALADRRLDAVLVDDDFAAWYLQEHPKLSVRRVAEFVPHARWNIAVAVHRDREELRNRISSALRHLISQGRVSKTFTDQGIAYRAPSAVTA